MKAFFIRQILPPVLVQLSIIVVLVYFEAKDFVPYVSPDEAGGGFSGGIGAGAERDADMAVAGRDSSTLLAAYPKPRTKTAMLLTVWLMAYPVLLFAAMVLLWQIFLQLLH